MTTLHTTNPFNVIASLNKHIEDSLAAITKPTWLPSYFVFYDFPESGLKYPAFSFHHTPLLMDSSWSGRITSVGEVGAQTHNTLEINIWVSRGNTSWSAQQRTMTAMLQKVFLDTKTVIIKDYLTNTSNPSATTNKINVRDLEGLAVAPNPNPDIERARFVIFYHWTQRSS